MSENKNGTANGRPVHEAAQAVILNAEPGADPMPDGFVFHDPWLGKSCHYVPRTKLEQRDQTIKFKNDYIAELEKEIEDLKRGVEGRERTNRALLGRLENVAAAVRVVRLALGELVS